jgi:hypothetical protein
MRIVLDTRFNKLEQFIDQLQNWDVDFRLLGASGFLGQVTQLVSRDIRVA